MKSAQQQKNLEIKQLINSGQYLAAESLLEKISHDFDQLNMKAYWLSKIHLYKNEYSHALSLLKQAEDQSFENLSIKADLCLCLYQLGFKSELHQKLEEIKKDIGTHIFKGDLNENFDAFLLLSKIFEEFGDLRTSQQILIQLEQLPLDSWQKQSIEIQLLRQAYEMKDTLQIEKLYNLLSRGINLSLNYSLEKEHALLLAGIELFGIRYGIEQYFTILHKPISASDQSFFTSEILEQILLSKHKDLLKNISIKILEKTESTYEIAIREIALAVLRSDTAIQIQLSRVEKEQPPLSLLRILRLLVINFPSDPQSEERQALFSLHLKALTDKKIQEQFRKSLSILTQAKKAIYDCKTKSISLEGKKIIVKNKLIQHLFECLQSRPEVSPETLAQQFYAEELNAQHFDRIRIAIYRFNNQVKAEFLIDDLFIVRKNMIEIQKRLIEYQS